MAEHDEPDEPVYLEPDDALEIYAAINGNCSSAADQLRNRDA